jgi:hypothetical protein
MNSGRSGGQSLSGEDEVGVGPAPADLEALMSPLTSGRDLRLPPLLVRCFPPFTAGTPLVSGCNIFVVRADVGRPER